jgi:hypothetical protein
MLEVWVCDQRLVGQVLSTLWIYLYLLKAGVVKLPRKQKKIGFGHAAVDILGGSTLHVFFFFSGRDKTILSFWKVRWGKIRGYMDAQHEIGTKSSKCVQ